MNSKKFFLKHSIVLDKNGDLYRFKAKAMPKLVIFSISLFCISAFFLICAFAGNQYTNTHNRNLFFFVGIFSFILGFVFLLKIQINTINYTLTIIKPNLLLYDFKNSFKCILDISKIKYEGTTDFISCYKKRLNIPYFSKDVDDELVKFLSDVGVTDLSQKEEPS